MPPHSGRRRFVSLGSTRTRRNVRGLGDEKTEAHSFCCHPVDGVTSDLLCRGRQPKSTDDAKFEAAKFYLSVAGGTGAIVVFAVGLWQYSRAQQWKRAEFLAQEMKDLLADPKSSNALIMIDWALRRIRLRAIENPEFKTRTVVTYEMQCRALQPHTQLEPVPVTDKFPVSETEADEEGAAEIAADAAVIGDRLRKFTRDEALIRDCYDSLLDRLDRLGGYIERRLMTARDMDPYLGYYIRDVASPATGIEALWSLCLLTYIHFYHFDGVRVLFESFGRSIDPEGEIFTGFIAGAPKEARDFALALQKLAIREFTAQKVR